MKQSLKTISGYILLIAIFGLVYRLTNKNTSPKPVEKPKSNMYGLFTSDVKDTVELGDSVLMILSVHLDTLLKKVVPKK
jgi:hypothetical protein